jgi:subtilisin family serine protease
MTYRKRQGRRALVAVAVTGLVLTASISAAHAEVAAQAAPDPGNPSAAASPDSRIRPSADPVPGQYIVTLAQSGVTAQGAVDRSDDLARRYSGRVIQHYSRALDGFAVRLSPGQAAALAADPAVATVEQDSYVHTDTTQANPPSWGLDRIDQPALPLDNSYTYTTGAAGVHAYIIDTGIRASHSDFGGRASVGADFVGDNGNGVDCSGHGTHVAGTVGGSAYGVAKSVSIVAVRVLTCGGSGSVSNVVAGIDWVTANAIKPAVANMSLSGTSSPTLDNAVAASIASGITYSVAAGNNSSNECTSTSPAEVTTALTVASTGNYEDASAPVSDARSSFSDFGPCVDVFAPGAYVTSDWYTSDSATNTISGTSMSTPHVTGVAALCLAAHPTATPAQVGAGIVAAAVPAVTGAGAGTTNRLLDTSVPCNVSPNPPAVTATVNGSAIQLAWTIPGDGGSPLQSFKIYKATTSHAETVLTTISNPSATSYDDAAVVPGTTYYYEVSAVNGIGDGALSNEVSAQVGTSHPLDVFAAGSDGSLLYRLDVVGGSWGALGPTTVGNPSVVSDGTSLWAFIRGSDNGLWYRKRTGTTWSGWVSLGPSIVSDPSAVWDGTRLWVFARGSDSGLWYRQWNGTTWSAWATRGTSIASNPSTVWDGAHARLWVFARGPDNGLWYQQWNIFGWSGWVGLGPSISGDPEGVVAGSSVWVFARGADNGLWYRRNTGPGPTTWGPWTPRGTTMISSPSAVSDGTNVWVFGLASDNGTWYQQWNGSSWLGAWTTLAPGPAFAGNPAALWDGANVWVFARGTDKAVWYRKLASGSWTSLGQSVKSDPAPIVWP